MAIDAECLILAAPLGLENFHDFCEHWGFEFSAKWEPDDQNPAFEECWTLDGGIFKLCYIYDMIAQLDYLTFSGQDNEGILADFSFSYNVIGKEELIAKADVDGQHNEQVDNLFRLSIAFAEYDSSVAAIFKKFMISSSSPLLRSAAVQSAARRVWTEIRNVVEHVATDDADDNVRAIARDVLSRWPNP